MKHLCTTSTTSLWEMSRHRDAVQNRPRGGGRTAERGAAPLQAGFVVFCSPSPPFIQIAVACSLAAAGRRACHVGRAGNVRAFLHDGRARSRAWPIVLNRSPLVPPSAAEGEQQAQHLHPYTRLPLYTPLHLVLKKHTKPTGRSDAPWVAAYPPHAWSIRPYAPRALGSQTVSLARVLLWEESKTRAHAAGQFAAAGFPTAAGPVA